MAQRHVVIVSRQFWPYMSDATQRISARAYQLHDLGYRVTVLTQKPNKYWPTKITIGPFAVVRLDGSYWNPLRAGSYAKRTAQWLEQEGEDLHTVVFDETGLEAIQFLSNAYPPSKTILRFDLSLRGDSSQWRPPKATLAAMRKADRIQTPNQVSRRALLAAGLERSRIEWIPEFHVNSLDRSIGARRAARLVLGLTSQDLVLGAHEKLIVCPGECNASWNVEDFTLSCLPFLESNPHVRLWILGDGNCRLRILDALRHHGLARAVQLPGIFSDLDTILQAADLCVFPGTASGLSALAPTCIHNDIPILLQQSVFTEEFLAGSDSAPNLLVDGASPWDVRLAQWNRDPNSISNATMQLRHYKNPEPTFFGILE